ncbi:slipin family protein [bacterium]|nr:slipin family protein [bacterium]
MYLIFVIVVVVFILGSAVRILNEYERGVIFRLGRVIDTKGPGLILLIPIIDKMVKVSLRLETRDVPPQDIITKDNVSVEVNAVIYYRVMDPQKAVIAVENYVFATLQFAQTTLRSVLGQVELDDLLASRDKINTQLQEIIDRHTDPWGIKVASVEIKHVDLPQEMRRAWAKQSEAERERRAKITHAEGEYQASIQLAQAARVIAGDPIALQLRYLQTLNEVAAENNSTLIFPIPIDLFTPFVKLAEKLTDKDGKETSLKLPEKPDQV